VKRWILLATMVFGAMFAVAAPAAQPDAKALADSTYVTEGALKPDRIVYVFIDTECPYCHRLRAAMQPYLGAGSRVQVRNILVAVLNEDSEPHAQAILMRKDTTQALAEHENAFDKGGIAKPAVLRADLSAKLASNQALMAAFGLRGTPSIVYQDADGKLVKLQGSPDAEGLAALMTPPKR
jgi:thiol:disulfide interchange protein DsbG